MIDRSNVALVRTLAYERERSRRNGDLTDVHRALIDRILAAWNDDRAERGKAPLSRAEAITLVLQNLAELLGLEPNPSP